MSRSHILGALVLLLAGHACTPEAAPRPRPPATPPASTPKVVAPAPVWSSLVPEPVVLSSPPSSPPTTSRLAPIVAGEVRCGERACKVPGEVCCEWSSEAHPDMHLECMPSSHADKCAQIEINRVGFAFGCDTSEDCAKGERCCAEDLPDTLIGVSHRCSSKACTMNESCSGASCPAGQSCNASGDELGSCAKNDADVACGVNICNGGTPVCHWSPESMTGTCHARNDPDPKHPSFTMRCDEQKDCPAGETCWANPIGNASLCCGKECFNDSEPSLFCKTDADCKSLGEAWRTCGVDPDYPDGLRVCRHKSEVTQP